MLNFRSIRRKNHLASREFWYSKKGKNDFTDCIFADKTVSLPENQAFHR